MTPEGLEGGSGTSVTRQGGLIVKHYAPGFDDYSGLGPVDTARKAALLSEELPALGVPVPEVDGLEVSGDEARLITRYVESGPFTDAHRLAAARVLRTLHGIELAVLSGELQGLLTRSYPNQGRIRLGVEEATARLESRVSDWEDDPIADRVHRLLEKGEPPPGEHLIHGDYFSVNLLAVPDGVVVTDWDLASPGDPMWDLGFLIGADRGLAPDSAEAVVDAYGRENADALSLAWHRECWDLFWLLRHRLG